MTLKQREKRESSNSNPPKEAPSEQIEEPEEEEASCNMIGAEPSQVTLSLCEVCDSFGESHEMLICQRYGDTCHPLCVKFIDGLERGKGGCCATCLKGKRLAEPELNSKTSSSKDKGKFSKRGLNIHKGDARPIHNRTGPGKWQLLACQLLRREAHGVHKRKISQKVR
jgi:hypothetical protein